MNHFIRLSLSDNTHVAEARRIGAKLAAQAEFSETAAGKLAIAISEAATNQIKHVGNGEMLFRIVMQQGINGIEVIALDKGPGVANIQNSLVDGFSTSGTSGTGLGAMARQSSYFDIYSTPSKGTAVFMQFWAAPLNPSIISRRTEIGVVATPIHGEEVCGDGWAAKHFVDNILLLIADGLGHGASAAEASETARRLFNQQTEIVPAEILKTLHLGMKATRGAAGAVVEANADTGIVRYAGIGNTAGIIVGSQNQRHMVSLNGTLGAQAQRIQEFNYEWSDESLLIFTTDGLTSQISLKDYQGLQQRHCSLIAAVIYRDFNRGRDDATVIVIRRKSE